MSYVFERVRVALWMFIGKVTGKMSCDYSLDHNLCSECKFMCTL